MTRTKAALIEFTSAPGERVRLHPKREHFAYSDGMEVEKRIYQVLKGTQDLSIGSLELMGKIQDWATEYHFSDTRANLLRHLRLGADLKVLELGAGCGAITRFLGERGCDVAAVEGSLLRARCASERTRDLGRVSVYCSDFQDIAFAREFDVVTLIGVLEYAPMFFAGEDPIGACLAVARSALKPGGTLVIAIENQLGLKYFAGATEDHLATHFSGIEGRYASNGVRTMGRRQLEGALQAAGFADVSFQYPFPDYKLPVAMVFEEALARDDFRAAEIVRHLYARDYSGKDLRSIDTSQVWPVLEQNGLLGYLSNSFLILGREMKHEEHALTATPDVLALTYSAGRAKRFQTQTAFRVDPAGAIVAEKALVYPLEAQSPPARVGISHRLTRDPYHNGVTLHSEITAALRAGDGPGVMTLLRRWIDFLGEAAGTAKLNNWQQRLPGEFWDCTPSNLIATEGRLRYIDAEWIADPGPEAGQLLLRYVSNLAYWDSTAPHFAGCFKAPAPFAIRHVVEALGMPLTQEALRDLANEINATNAVIFPLKPKIALERKHFIESAKQRAVRRATAAARHLVARLLRGVSGTAAR